jgi:phosphoribosylformylglycinamidine cyclo-ligase
MNFYMTVNYKTAGVDTEAGDRLVDWLQSNKGRVPHQERIVSGIGGFASLFNIQFPEMKKPLLVTCTDGVGTKVKIASYFQDYEGVGQDLVAMCVNDLICTGGRPLMFLDYYATGKLDLKAAQQFLASVQKACLESECALVGGETAEMPGVYQTNDFDCAGFAVGIVDQEKTWGPHKVKEGDQLIGVSSSGFHSNGFSLLRKVFGPDLEEHREVLLKPTALYVKLALELQKSTTVHGAAHVTGGGIENLPRLLPDELAIHIPKLWPLPSIYEEVKRRTQLSTFDLLKTFNCGIGFVLAVPPGSAEAAREISENHHFKTFDLGSIVKRKGHKILEIPGVGELCE